MGGRSEIFSRRSFSRRLVSARPKIAHISAARARDINFYGYGFRSTHKESKIRKKAKEKFVKKILKIAFLFFISLTTHYLILIQNKHNAKRSAK